MRRLILFIVAMLAATAVELVPGTHAGHDSPLAQIRTALAQAGSFLEPFNGAPASPQPWRPTAWDVQLDVTDSIRGDGVSTVLMQAHHSGGCGAPPGTHPVTRVEDAVFLCNDHIMTAVNAGYGAVYLTPNAQVDFSGGEAVVRFDLSTFRTVGRDWVDLWVTPFEENLALPLEDWGPAYQGEPRRAIHIRMDGGPTGTIFVGEVIRDFTATSLGGPAPGGYEQYLTPSASRRDPFELRISRTRVRFGMPSYNIWWVDAPVTDLGWSRGVVQFGHHSYNPTKGCDEGHGGEDPSGQCANTWHWDNVSISPAAPFTILRGSPRLLREDQATQATFPSPAPANAYLRFAGVGDNLEVSVDGGSSWRPAVRQAQEQDKGEHWSSYWTPIPAGTTSVQVRGRWNWAGPWAIQNLAIWATAAPPPAPNPPPGSAPPGGGTAPPTCSPRPPIGLTAVPNGSGQLQVTISAGRGSLHSLQFGAATNALIDIGGQAGRTGNFTVQLAPGVGQTGFTVRRANAGAATTVPLVVTDDCGSWSTFVGGGAGAF